MSSREVIRLLENGGWVLDRVKGSHYQFAHPTKPGTVTVPHPRRDIPIGTLRSIEKHSGVMLR
jgi:Predicted periplasmic or secreted lipoprotein